MNAAPTPAGDIPVGKLEPAKPSRKTAPANPILKSRPYEDPNLVLSQLPRPGYVIPGISSDHLPPQPSFRGKTWPWVALIVGLLFLGSGFAFALFQSTSAIPIEIANQIPTEQAPPIMPPAVPPSRPVEPTPNPPNAPDAPPAIDNPEKSAPRENIPFPVDPIDLKPVNPKPAPMPLNIPGIDQPDIDKAILRGVTYLKNTQLPNGTWSPRGHAVGYSALPGLTLLECGMSPQDPVITLTADFIRSQAGVLDHTYELSLAVLFLDRLKDPRDQGLIQTLALRLVAGQTDGGGWTYVCPILSPDDAQPFRAFLEANRLPRFQNPLPVQPGDMKNPLVKPGNPLPNPLSKPGSSGYETPLSKPGEALLNPLVKPGENKGPSPGDAKNFIKPIQSSDDANQGNKPQEAKPGVPPPITRNNLPPRVRDLPIVANLNKEKVATKGKGKTVLDRFNHDDNSNTQFALLALWAARRHGVPTERSLQLGQKRFQSTQNGDGGWSYVPRRISSSTMTCVGLLGLAMGHGTSSEVPDSARPPQSDPAINRGLIALSKSIGNPGPAGSNPSMENLYLLWSVERVAMLYNLSTIGGKDWYGWGAQILVKNQQAAGDWHSGRYPGSTPRIDTCFALLFLKRSNLVSDLTNELPRFISVIEGEKARK